MSTNFNFLELQKDKAHDVLSAPIMSKAITFPCKVHVLDIVDSTNAYARRLFDYSLPNLIVSNQQTKGKGRLGRSFYSPSSKGIYMSIVFEPDFGIEKAMLITPLAAVAVCRALKEVTGTEGKIKWVNDIFLGEKKVCGILTEADNNPQTGKMEKIIVGIGINCFQQEFPEDLKDKASFIDNPTMEYSRNELIAAVTNNFFDLLANFDKKALLEEYRSLLMILGKDVVVYGTSPDERPENGGKGSLCHTIDIDENCGLVVEHLDGPICGKRETLTSGEVTIRKK